MAGNGTAKTFKNLKGVLNLYILGISCYYHDSAAALLKDGKVIAAVEEERFSREKNDDGFPSQAIDYCMKEARISGNDLTCITFYDKPVLKFERLLDNYITLAPRGFGSFINVIPKWLHKRIWIKEEIKKHFGGYKGKIYFPEHHLSHAAYTYFTSPFDQAAILTADGVGEWTTTSFGYAKDTTIKLTHDIRWPHSVGMLYSAFTYYLGFTVNEGEYKLMGLSSYGKPKYYDLIMKELVDVKDDGSLRLNMKYFAYTWDKVMINSKFEELFGTPRRTEDAKTEQIHYDIGASAQLVLEEILLKMARHVHKKTNLKNLCLGGGVALNGVANYRILKEGPFEQIHIPPSPGDGGSAIGCAAFAYYSILNNERIIESDPAKMISNNVYLGPQYSNDEIKSFLESNNIPYQKYEPQELLKRTAKLISEQNVVGWYQGRVEWGPRALGNRSILADPRNAKMKDILNAKIKHRESFRPFAPSILEDYESEYFDLEIPSPFMLLVSKVKKPEVIPAVTHVDGTSRIQTVSRKANSLYYDLINEFFKLTGVPVILNTSMNVRGEPIVNTPEQAYAMLVKTDMDYLVMGNYLIHNSN